MQYFRPYFLLFILQKLIITLQLYIRGNYSAMGLLGVVFGSRLLMSLLEQLAVGRPMASCVLDALLEGVTSSGNLCVWKGPLTNVRSTSGYH